jgi:hypothetical protein
MAQTKAGSGSLPFYTQAITRWLNPTGIACTFGGGTGIVIAATFTNGMGIAIFFVINDKRMKR